MPPTTQPSSDVPPPQEGPQTLHANNAHQQKRLVDLIKLLKFTKVVTEVLVKNKLLYLPILLNATEATGKTNL